MAFGKLSVGFAVTSALFAAVGSSACSDTAEPIKAGPSGAGARATSGGSASSSAGASGTATAGSSGNAGGSAGGSAGAGTGFPPVGDKCGPNTTKKDGLCFCQPATLNACSSGCGDFRTDPDRCGNCDTQCGATQGCHAGKCSATPTTLVPAATGCGSIKLAVASGTLYWTAKDEGTLRSVATTGGSAKTLVTGADGAYPTHGQRRRAVLAG